MSQPNTWHRSWSSRFSNKLTCFDLVCEENPRHLIHWLLSFHSPLSSPRQETLRHLTRTGLGISRAFCKGCDGMSVDVRLWIDAVCTNQKDDEERNAQVTMMSNIYTSCQHVFVWLGECELLKLFPGPIRFLSRDTREEMRQLLDKYVLDFKRPMDEIDYSFHIAGLLFLLKDSPTWKRDKTVDFTSHSQPPYWTKVGHGANKSVDVSKADFRFNEYTDGLQLALRALQRSPWFSRI